MNDLTWAELLAALAPNSVFVDPTRGVCISASLVSGESTVISTLTAPGVVEFGFKLLEAANKAQATKNNSLPAGSKLNAFADTVWSTPNANGAVTARQSVNALFMVSTATATAPLK
jgi:hypothetical protein